MPSPPELFKSPLSISGAQLTADVLLWQQFAAEGVERLGAGTPTQTSVTN